MPARKSRYSSQVGTFQGSRRRIDTDFALNSHHVGTGGVMGGTLSFYDCIVCHAEGEAPGGAEATTSYHMDGACTGGTSCIDLYDADNPGNVFSYDLALIESTAGVAGGGSLPMRTPATGTRAMPIGVTSRRPAWTRSA